MPRINKPRRSARGKRQWIIAENNRRLLNKFPLGRALPPEPPELSDTQRLINTLFSNGEQGVWYEPKPQYLFQDAAGTVPVTADGDPVGHMQDLSRGLELGPEIIDNGDFSTNDLSSWTIIYGFDKETRVEDGRLIVEETGSGRAAARLKYDFVEGKQYVLRVTAGYLTKIPKVDLPDGSSQFVNGTYEIKFIANGSNFLEFDYIGGNVRGSFFIDNVSVRELLGNHATQSTSAARPLYPGLAHDGVDDTLIAPNASLPDLTTVYARVKRTGPDKGIIFGGNDAFALVYQSDSSTSLPNATEIDGQVVNTRAQAFDAMTENTWVLVKVLNVDTSFTGFTDIQTVGYRGNSDTNFHSQCEVGALIAVSATSASENDAEIIGYLEASA